MKSSAIMPAAIRPQWHKTEALIHKHHHSGVELNRSKAYPPREILFCKVGFRANVSICSKSQLLPAVRLRSEQ